MSELELKLNESKVKKMIYFNTKSVLYRKIITFFLSLIAGIDKIFCHSKNYCIL